jgi:hypothetical protein
LASTPLDELVLDPELSDELDELDELLDSLLSDFDPLLLPLDEPDLDAARLSLR